MAIEQSNLDFTKGVQEVKENIRCEAVDFFIEMITKNNQKSGSELIKIIFNNACDKSPAFVLALLKKLGDLKKPTFELYNFAAKAIANNEIQYIVALHEGGYDFTFTPSGGYLPLLFKAIKYNLKDMVAKLVLFGAIPDKEYRFLQDTPLTFAAIENAGVEIIKIILSTGVMPDARNKCGQTALHYAIRNRNLEVVRLLATVTTYDTLPESSGLYVPEYIVCAMRSEDVDIIREIFIMSGSKILTHHISQAIRENRLTTMEFFIQSGLDVNTVLKNGYTIMHCTCDIGRIEMLKMLLSHGAKTDVKSENGMLPIYIAMCSGNQDMVQLLESQSQ